MERRQRCGIFKKKIIQKPISSSQRFFNNHAWDAIGESDKRHSDYVEL